MSSRGDFTHERRTAPSSTLLVAALLLTSATACREAPTEQKRPDVVLIVVDTLRTDRLPFYGAPRNTAPFLYRLSDESWVFENAYAPSSWTLPSMVSLFTSTHPFQHGVVTLEGLELGPEEEPVPVACIPTELVTLPELLQQNGYRTFGVASNLLLTEDVGFARGFDRYVMFEDDPADSVKAQVSLWRNEILESDPFFLYLHFIDPHDTFHRREPWWMPYASPTDAGWPPASIPRTDEAHEQIDWIRTRIEPLPPEHDGRPAEDLSEPELDRLFSWMKSHYDSEIGLVDATLEELFDTLGLDDAVVVFVSDHGEEFYEHGDLTHGFNLYAETLRVPLLVRLPGGQEAGHVSDPVGTLDVLPTLRRLLGLPPGEQDEGVDLFARSEGRRVHGMLDSKAGYEVQRDLRSISTAEHRLIAASDGSFAELYELANDPRERIDLASRYPALVEELREQIEYLHRSAKRYELTSCMPSPADEKRLERLRAIGYLGDEPE